MNEVGHLVSFQAISFHMTPSYYNKWTGHGHFETDVELVCNFPLVQFKIMVYYKKLRET